MASELQRQREEDDRDSSSSKSSIDVLIERADAEGYSDEDSEAGDQDFLPEHPQRPIRRWSLIFLATATIALFTLLAVLLYPGFPPAAPPPAPENPTGPIKVMIIGDSITHGYEGDYSWRYRLWEWFRAMPDTNVSFVGPFAGTFPPPDKPRPPAPQPTSPGLETRTWGGYARDVDGAFLEPAGRGGGKAHFAHWGRQMVQYEPLVEDAVRAARPDYVLLALGFNDIAWARHPRATIASLGRVVGNVRRAKRDVRFAVANAPHRTAMRDKPWLPGTTDEYNALLEAAVAELASGESPVGLVRLRENYACDVKACPAAHDGLHPNALGEYQIAQAFSQVLHQKYGFGASNLTIPSAIPDRPCSAPTNVEVIASLTEDNIRTVTVRWDSFYGAFGYFVQARRKDLAWGRSFFTDRREYEMFWIPPGRGWEVRVSTHCGDQQPNSPWSDVVRVGM